MRRFTTILLLVLLAGVSAPRVGEAASISELSARARQAQGQVGGKVRGDSSVQQQAIQILGPIALDLLSAPDLARAVGDPAQKPLVRNVYDILSGPLETIYERNFSHINGMQKAVMDQDGDLDALYETKEWREAQTVASQSLYFLNWLHYVGASLFDGEKKKKLLEEAADGFSEFVAGEQKSQIRRESLLGRALCYRELKKYDSALRDFELLLKDEGLPSDMQRKARLGMIEAAARAGEADKAIAAADQFLAQAGSSVPPEQLARVRTVRSYALQIQKQGGAKKKFEEAMAQAEASKEAQAAEESQFLQWEQAKGHLQKSEFDKAVPLLKEVVASTDPKAAEHKREAQYLLGVCLFKGGQFRDSAEQLGQFLGTDGKPPKFGAEAAYLRFKAAENLYARQQSEENSKLYVDATKDFIRREPGHPSIFEAYFRLGEYNQRKEQFLPAIDAYQKVHGDPAFRTRADYAILQSYFSLLELENGKRDGIGISEKELRQRIASSLQTFWKSNGELEKKNPALAKQGLFREQRGKVSVMNAVFLSQEDNKDARAAEIVALLQDFETKYPDRKEAFSEVARMRLVALEKTGRFTELERNVDNIFTRFKPDEQKELLAGLTQVLENDIKKLERKQDKENTVAAKRTFARLKADRLQRGEAFAADESEPKFKYELAQLYLDVKAYDQAKPLYQELRQGAYSLAALAGLAQIAEVEGKQREAVGHWEQMLKETQVGDPLWFRGTFEFARLNAAAGNADLACRTVNSTRPMLNRLGDPGLKKKIQALATQSCGA